MIKDIETELKKRNEVKALRLKRMRKKPVTYKSKYLKSVYSDCDGNSLSMRILSNRIPLLKNGLITGIQVKGFIRLTSNVVKFIEDNDCVVVGDRIQVKTQDM